MFNRKEIKARGKIAFKANYWKCVLIALLASVIGGEFTSAISSKNGFNYGFRYGYNHHLDSSLNQGLDHSVDNMISGNDLFTSFAASGIILAVIMIAAIVGIVLAIFVLNPLKLGCANFFMLNRNSSDTDLNNVGIAFSSNYSNVVKVTFMRDLFIFLWSLLFVIPGIIKSYDYRLVDYLLSQNPDMEYHEALDTSRDLMYGNRMSAFVLDLSFIGWSILSVMTFGILGVFYVSPYINATNAELFWTLAHPESTESFNYEAAPDEAQTVEFDVR